MLGVIRRWPFAAGMFAVHALVVLLLYFAWRSSTDPEREMMWLWPMVFDFPMSCLYALIEVRSHVVTAFTSIMFGGFEWAVVGSLLDLLRKRFFTKPSLRGQPDI